MLIGMVPCTDWLGPEIALDRWGFVLTGQDVPRASWPLDRSPPLYQTILPRVLAVGDVRHGSVKRVAAAVGDGSVVIRLIHEALRGG